MPDAAVPTVPPYKPPVPLTQAPAAPSEDAPPENTPPATPAIPGAMDVDALEDQVLNLGKSILDELRKGFTSIQLTPAESEIAARAASALAECQILSIGAGPGVLEHLQQRTQRATSTLMQLYAGEAVEARRAVQTTILAVLKQVIRAALVMIGSVKL